MSHHVHADRRELTQMPRGTARGASDAPWTGSRARSCAKGKDRTTSYVSKSGEPPPQRTIKEESNKTISNQKSSLKKSDSNTCVRENRFGATAHALNTSPGVKRARSDGVNDSFRESTRSFSQATFEVGGLDWELGI